MCFYGFFSIIKGKAVTQKILMNALKKDEENG